MADFPDEQETTKVREHRFDPVSLVAGVGALLVAAYTLTDGVVSLPEISGRWLLAGGAAFIAVLMLIASFGRKN